MSPPEHASPAPHPLIGPLSWLLGSWEGKGEGYWRGGFSFLDSLTFEHDGRPLISFHESTRTAEGVPSHGEHGYVIAKEDGVVHMTVAEPSGITEALAGHAVGCRLEVTSVEISRTPGSKAVSGVARRLYLNGGEMLVAEVDIAMNGEPTTAHTRSVLRRVTSHA